MGEIITAEEFFSDIDFEDAGSGNSPCVNQRHGERNEALFERVKVKMVMRIHGVSPEKAREIIAARAMASEGHDEEEGD